MEKMDEYWSMNEATFACLHDSKRTRAFRKAIRNSVKKGDTVLDTGAGSGILSMFAIDAGAKHVYAIELDKGNIKTLEKVITENGYSDKITVLEGDATKIRIPEKVNFIICEMIATGLIEELQVPVMNNVIKFLKPDGKVLLSNYSILVEAVFSKSNFYNKKFNIIRFELPEMRDMRAVSFSNQELVRSIDFTKTVKRLTVDETIKIRINKTGTINAIRLMGETIFSDKSKFANSTAYDFPIILPVDETYVEAGNSINLKLSYKLCGGTETLKYKLV